MSNNPVPIPPNLVFPDTLTPFNYYCQRVLPAVYGDEISYYELLCKVTNYLNETMSNVNKTNVNVQEIYKYVQELYKIMDEFIASGFQDYYANIIKEWIDKNLEWIFTTVVKQVYFGLSLEGYFVAFIPQSWSDIIFDTGADYTLDTYGRLILSWDVDSSSTFNQTPEKVR